MGMTRLLRQPFSQPALPNVSFASRTIIVTGANVGLGQAAAAHFVRLGAARVIATCRSESKCAATLAGIEETAGRKGVVQVWKLNCGSYASVLAFCERVDAELDRLDAVVLNAGVATRIYEVAEGDESSLTVNVVSTTLLAALLLPVLRRSAGRFSSENTLSVTGSEIHQWAKFPERNEASIFGSMSDPKSKTMAERYPASKLLQVFAIREVAERTRDSTPFVTVNTVSPGLNKTSLTRSSAGFEAAVMKILNAMLAWEPDVGARTLVHGVVAGRASHGVLLDHCKLKNDALAPWIETNEGKRLQKNIWAELETKLEAIRPGCLAAMEGKEA